MQAVEVLARHVDGIVLLGSFAESTWVPEACATLAPHLPIVQVKEDELWEGVKSYPPDRRGVAVVKVGAIATRGRAEQLYEELLARRIIRPLFLADGAAFDEVLTASRAPFRVVVVSTSALQELTSLSRGGDLAAARARFLQYQALQHAGDARGQAALEDAFHAYPQRLRYARSLRAADLVLAEEAASLAPLCQELPFPCVIEPASRAALCEQLAKHVEERRTSPVTDPPVLNIAYLYDHHSTYVSTIAEYLESFGKHSRHRICFVPATNEAVAALDLSGFDILLAHYSMRMYPDTLWIAPSYQQAMRRFGGYKALFIQDEYDITDNARRRIQEFGFHTVFTCVPEPYIEAVYPKAMFPRTHFINVLTGYVSAELEQVREVPAMCDRTTVIGYRGRPLAFYYGDLGQEKINIGRRMRAECEQRGIKVDIEWDEHHRIYADAWHHFLMGCKATLGTESGANLFDDTGSLRKAVQAELAANPSVSYEEVASRHFQGLEGKVRMNQISPKIFESIALRTALVLFEGAYSGVVRPHEHFIPLKKDFSNLDEVLARLADDDYLTQLTERAYQDVVASGAYSYARLVGLVDAHLDREVRRGGYVRPQSAVISWVDPLDQAVWPSTPREATRLPADHLTSYVLGVWSQPLQLDPTGSVAWEMQSSDAQASGSSTEERPLKKLRAIPVAAWVDDKVFKPFNRIWEHHRKRLQRKRRS